MITGSARHGLDPRNQRQHLGPGLARGATSRGSKCPKLEEMSENWVYFSQTGMGKSVLIGHLEKADTGGGEFQSLGAFEWINFQRAGFSQHGSPQCPPPHFTYPPFRQGKRHGHAGDPRIAQIMLETSHFLNALQE